MTEVFKATWTFQYLNSRKEYVDKSMQPTESIAEEGNIQLQAGNPQKTMVVPKTSNEQLFRKQRGLSIFSVSHSRAQSIVRNG